MKIDNEGVNGKDINGKYLWEKMASANMTGDQIKEELEKVVLEEQIEKIRERNTSADAEILIKEVTKKDKYPRFSNYVQGVTVSSEEDDIRVHNTVTKVEVYESLEQILKSVKAISPQYVDIDYKDQVIKKLQATIKDGKFIADGTRD